MQSSATNKSSGSSRSSSGRVGPSTLPRGGACLACRQRKMRCDGGRPSCVPCIRGDRTDSCEYEDTFFLATTKELVDQIHALQARICELEDNAFFQAVLCQDDPASRRLLGPNSNKLSFAAQQSLALQPTDHPVAGFPTLQQPVQEMEFQDANNVDCLALRQELLTQFVHHAHEFGLPWSSIALLGQHAALTEASCAAAAPASTFVEYSFVQRAETELAHAAELPSALDVQAAALLALLSFARGRPGDGQRQLNVALRFEYMLGLREVDPPTWGMVCLAAARQHGVTEQSPN